jgi:hypothetical protein
VAPADTQWPDPQWVYVHKHHRPPGVGEAAILASTAKKDSPSVYLIDRNIVRRVELETVDGFNRPDNANTVGHEILPRKGSQERHFWRELPDNIGASKGQRTKFIYVLYHFSGGAVHGYPVTREYLQSIPGVDL